MALLKELKGSFVGGQVSPELQDRTDLEKFNTFLKEAKNTKIKPEGGISNRAGTIFIGVAKDATFRLTINVNVSATIIINGVSYTGTTKSVDLPVDSEYTYSVGASGYETQEDSGPLTGNKEISVTLEISVEQYTFTITNDQSATISISVDGATPTTGTGSVSVTENSGATITWSVEKEGYVTQGGTFVLSEDTTEVITLVEISEATLTINATPADSTIKINGVEVGTGTASQNLQINSAYTYEVSNSGYITQSGSGTITQNTTINITMQESFYQISGIKTEEANHYVSYLKIQTLFTRTIATAGTYRITLKGACGYSKFVRSSDNSTTITKYGKGGTLVCEKSFTVGQVLTFKKISGASQDYSVPTGSIFRAGGCGIELLVDGSIVLVAGGGGAYETKSYQSGDKYNGFGGGGYVGGNGWLWNGGGYVDQPDTTRGYSKDGTRGQSQVTNTGACGEKSAHGNGYGGTGYVATGYTATTQYSANNDNGYIILEFVE